MNKNPKILNRNTVASSKLFRIEAMKIEFSNGEQRDYERLARSNSSGAVLIIPMLDKETVLLIREYSAGVDRYELGLPKGKIDRGEDRLIAANRELKEEVGYGADQLTYLNSLTLAPAYMEHTIDIILAEHLFEEKLQGDEPEPLEVVPWKLHDIQRLLQTGECTEARSIAALYLVKDYLAQK